MLAPNIGPPGAIEFGPERGALLFLPGARHSAASVPIPGEFLYGRSTCLTGGCPNPAGNRWRSRGTMTETVFLRALDPGNG